MGFVFGWLVLRRLTRLPAEKAAVTEPVPDKPAVAQFITEKTQRDPEAVARVLQGWLQESSAPAVKSAA